MTRGGVRKGAGRPTGTGLFGEPTTPVRIPVSRIEDVRAFLLQDAPVGDAGQETLPLYGGTVQAGNPALAAESVEAHMNLHHYVVNNPKHTFFVRAKGQSMVNVGIDDGDLLIVDKSIAPRDGHIVVAAVGGGLTVKRLKKLAQGLQLLPENDAYQPINVTEDEGCQVWGVVTNVVHKL
ncbi:MAG: translesion error-prone DNA polymerase V autoproteolytic subunit [Alphaproteobacteria bacterium]